MSKPSIRISAFSLPVTLSAEEKRHKELQEKYKEMKRRLAEKKAVADKNDKKVGKRTMEEAEEATHELIKKVQEGKITMKKSDDKHTFKRARLLSGTEGKPSMKGYSEDGEILDPFEDDLQVSSTMVYQDKNKESGNQRTIYVKGYELQKETLRATFEKYGNIKRINIAERKGHAFIEFNFTQEAVMAIREMDGNMLGGTIVHVSMARRKDDNQGPPRMAFDGGSSNNA